MHDGGIGTQEALDNAGTAADSLRAKIALAKQQVAASESRIAEAQQAVDNCIIRAPFAGIVVSKDAQVGRDGVAESLPEADLRALALPLSWT